jgi:hypothetical protein
VGQFRTIRSCAVVVASLLAAIEAKSQLGDRPLPGSPDDSVIAYSTTPTSDPVSEYNRNVGSATVNITFDPRSGYLRSLLDALHVPAASQVLVFSKTGVQGARTSPTNPRALFFNDSVVVGFVRGAPFLEIADQDPTQGAIFYLVQQEAAQPARAARANSCLTCHLSYNSLDVPGFLVRSMFTRADGTSMPQAGSYLVDHRTPIANRWGGYYVTGAAAMHHMGNAVVEQVPGRDPDHNQPNMVSIDPRIDLTGYPATSSDVAALLVFDHQLHLMNLLTRVGWEVRLAVAEHRLDLIRGEVSQAIDELVDYLFFMDEAPVPALARESEFASAFAATRPRDRRGRSLRDLQLDGRLMRYPCSYMIYAPAFDSLPAPAKGEIYRRMWQVLSGERHRSTPEKLSHSNRQAIVEILRDTKSDLPAYFLPTVP